ncbi:MAG: CAP domain-containing protein [Clostridiales bacterium]|jgi:uncharacterized protein YkwD|nr:CAP domain-containing protein [Clostridiales bacterium]
MKRLLAVCAAAGLAILMCAAIADDSVTREAEKRVADEINARREEYGAPPLVVNWQLARAARYKAEDMRDSGRLGHRSLRYGTPADMLTAFHIPFRALGEVVAAGQIAPEDAVAAWMASEVNRASILSEDFTEIGVGYAPGDGGRWVAILLENDGKGE